MNPWDRRIARAQVLQKEYPQSTALLGFYIDIARFQKSRGSREELIRLIDRAAPAKTSDQELAGFMERVLAQANASTHEPQPIAGNCCPVCGGGPVVSVLRPEGEGGKRSLICSVCFTEWAYRRLGCVACPEEDPGKLPVYTAEQFTYVRIEACDSCRTYIKSIDMTRNGLAVPEVDDLATLPLDLWAAEKGYSRRQPNIFGV